MKKKSKLMNILLWVLQILFAFWNLWGGVYMIINYKILVTRAALSALPQPFWIGLGVIQVLFAIGLLIPSKHKLVSFSAMVLAAIALLGVLLYVAYQGFPNMLWAIIPAIFAAFIAYERRK